MIIFIVPLAVLTYATHLLWTMSEPGEIWLVFWIYLFSMIAICAVLTAAGIVELLFGRATT